MAPVHSRIATPSQEATTIRSPIDMSTTTRTTETGGMALSEGVRLGRSTSDRPPVDGNETREVTAERPSSSGPVVQGPSRGGPPLITPSTSSPSANHGFGRPAVATSTPALPVFEPAPLPAPTPSIPPFQPTLLMLPSPSMPSLHAAPLQYAAPPFPGAHAAPHYSMPRFDTPMPPTSMPIQPALPQYPTFQPVMQEISLMPFSYHHMEEIQRQEQLNEEISRVPAHEQFYLMGDLQWRLSVRREQHRRIEELMERSMNITQDCWWALERLSKQMEFDSAALI